MGTDGTGIDRTYKVLIVDDNPNLLSIITDSLLELGNFQVVTAADGAEGLAAFYAEHPDCMVIDVKMPGLDGYQLVRAIRGDPETAGTPLVILTALAQDINRFTGIAAGVDCYLTKPVKPQDLVASIQQAIARSESERRQQLRVLVEEPPPEA
jgi:two-component system alkaline phosphatase synthesis response regulator PhoP